MKLLFRRSQHLGIFGKIVFTLTVRAEISDEERDAIRKYKFGDTVLFQMWTITGHGYGILGLLSWLYFKAMNMTISVRHLARGKSLTSTKIDEIIEIQEHILKEATNFSAMLEAARRFGGEDAIDLAA